MDTLIIKGMHFRGKHGVHPFEKKEGNDFEVDVMLKTDLSKAGETDNLSQTPDYTQVERMVREVMLGPSKDLIEHLAYTIGEAIQEWKPDLSEIEVCIRKMNPPLESKTDHTEVRMSWPR